MKAGVILTLRVAGLPAKVTGIYTENTGIILDGSIQLASKGSLRAALEFLLQKSGYAVNLSFLPQLQAETVWMTYCQKTSEMGFGIRLWEGEKELGQIRAVVRAKEEKFLFCLSSVKTLRLSEIPVAGNFMGNGSLGPVECILESDGGRFGFPFCCLVEVRRKIYGLRDSSGNRGCFFRRAAICAAPDKAPS